MYLTQHQTIDTYVNSRFDSVSSIFDLQFVVIIVVFSFHSFIRRRRRRRRVRVMRVDGEAIVEGGEMAHKYE